MLNKQELVAKYKHQLILKNFSESTVISYLGCLNFEFCNRATKPDKMIITHQNYDL